MLGFGSIEKGSIHIKKYVDFILPLPHHQSPMK